MKRVKMAWDYCMIHAIPVYVQGKPFVGEELNAGLSAVSAARFSVIFDSFGP